MKKFYKVTLPAITLLLSLPTHGKSLFSLSKPASEQEKTIQISRIVGGEQATQGDWPWMTALVSTDAPTSTSLTVGNTAFVTESFSFAPEGSASGELAECGLAGSVCGDVEGKVCLIERGEFNFSVKADNCQAGGGIGAIIYNNVEGNITNGTMGSDFTGTIPVVAISQADGQNLLNQLGESASLSVTILPGQTQDSSCGATFLGDKWVLTAAHCVDEPFSRSLQLNVGEHNLADGAQNAIGIRNIFIHPQYDAPTIDYDIAIIELTESVDAPAVKLANASTTDQLAQLNSPVTVIGWGGRLGYQPDEGPTGDFPDILHQTELSLQTNQQCRVTFSQSQGVQPQFTGVSDVMICADFPGGGRSACQGDSGGPLLANTNEGWQQVGIVSWGVGCAADGYPGVYTRVAAFNGWVQAITQGVSLVNPGLLPNIPLDSEISTTVDVMNNTEQSQSLSFSSSSSEYSISPDQCLTLAAGETCSLTVTFSPQSAGFKTANLSVTTETSGIETENIVLSAISLSQSSAFDDVLATDSNLINWYSGGDNAWVVTAGGGIESGTIGNTQDSILLASIEGAGELTFEWSVSSEDNTDDPDDPFDALYLKVNGEDIEFISGDVPFTSNQVSLNEGTNLVEWTYNKDLFTAERQDKGFLRNVVFTPEGTTTPPPQPSPPPAPTTPPPAPTPSSSGGSGGALSGFILLLVPLLIIRRRLYPFYLKMLSFSWR